MRLRGLPALVWVLGAAVAAPSPMRAADVFGPGEQATYRIRFLGIPTGTAQVTIGAETTQWGRSVWPIVTIANTDPHMGLFPVHDKFVTYWEPGAQRTVGSELFADENHRRRRVEVRLDHARGQASVLKQRDGAEDARTSVDIPPGVFDMAAATFALRNRALSVGDKFDLPVFTGKKSLTLRATVEARQKLVTARGDRDVLRVRIQASFTGGFQATGDLIAYVAMDATHLPVRVEAPFVIGTFVAELTDYKPGADGPRG